MTQPPGPYGDAFDTPRYEPTSYGPYAQPGQYAQPNPYGPPPQPPRPRKKNLLPWLIVGGAVLLSGIGIMLVVLFTCTAGQDAATTAAAGGDPAYELGRYFYEQVLGGVGFTGGTFDSIEHDPATGADVGVFSLDLEDGNTFTLLVYVQEDLTVCDFI